MSQDRVEALIVDNVQENLTNRRVIVELGERARLPATYPWRDHVERALLERQFKAAEAAVGQARAAVVKAKDDRGPREGGSARFKELRCRDAARTAVLYAFDLIEVPVPAGNHKARKGWETRRRAQARKLGPRLAMNNAH